MRQPGFGKLEWIKEEQTKKEREAKKAAKGRRRKERKRKEGEEKIMAKEKACKICKRIYEGDKCPNCGSKEFSDSFQGKDS